MTENDSDYYDELVKEKIDDKDHVTTGGSIRQKHILLNSGSAFVKLQLPFHLEGPILDSPCGYGRFLIPIAESGIDSYGVDLSFGYVLRCLNNSKERSLDVGLVRADIRRLPFKSGFFKTIICLSSIYHINQKYWQDILAQFASILPEKGRLVVNVKPRTQIYSRKYGFGLFVIAARTIYETERYRIFKSFWKRLGFRPMRGNYCFFASKRDLKRITEHEAFVCSSAEGTTERVTFVLEKKVTTR